MKRSRDDAFVSSQLKRPAISPLVEPSYLKKSITEVYQEVSVLFQEHADLLVEFTHFLPDTSGAASIQYPQPGRNHTLNGDDRGSPMTASRPIQIDKSSGIMLRKKRRREKTKKTMMSLDHKRKSARRDDSVTDLVHRGMQDPESAFLEKVKERLPDPEINKKISDCVRPYKSKLSQQLNFGHCAKAKDITVASLLGTHPELMEACEDFITYIEKTGGCDGEDHDREDREKNKDHDNRERERHDRGLAFSNKDVLGQKMSSYASKEKFMWKSIQDLDLSNCERCTPSYRLLPQNYPIPSASRRTKIGAKVLNDHWVSVTSGSEDYSFKHMRKNQYEESLFRCEDDRFELDMLLESVNATAKRVEELLEMHLLPPGYINPVEAEQKNGKCHGKSSSPVLYVSKIFYGSDDMVNLIRIALFTTAEFAQIKPAFCR
ncbi:Paired amphipathic helix protein Sin3-like 2 [Sesamum angolense]|uniref:Paired amphipathic helix protein Sin3-like 2 n=1 Tax=Sesamum angolense TaxID=2727404 RepID=A0AAE2BZ78_9LAMI|nr:Paired amphipathic helix protein Sin3-like 2 [Sesamum angolense]